MILCFLVGAATGGSGIKAVNAASDVGSTPDATSFLFLPLVSQHIANADVAATINNDNSGDDKAKDDNDDDDDDNGANYNPKIDPENFVSGVDNPYFTLTPGTVFFYEGTSPEGATEKSQVEVTPDKKKILGIETTVVRDRVWENGELVEDTYDWYTQDKKGNVWYFGEYASNYEAGVVVNHDGSWEAGVNKAKPGIIMEANPEVGDVYRQEYLKGEAEDQAEVLSTTASVTTKLGSFKDCLQTKDFTRLEPGIVENKFYCKEVRNLVLSKGVAGESGQSELVKVKKK